MTSTRIELILPIPNHIRYVGVLPRIHNQESFQQATYIHYYHNLLEILTCLFQTYQPVRGFTVLLFIAYVIATGRLFAGFLNLVRVCFRFNVHKFSTV